ncbi:toll/interleukin-1 receptor domain-containing protein [Piscinibacter sakaiensis]|uniref:toll/interleukin-1 receptor domain-containing protein n=1 Tax=Piscinibacter sakaiensis TaxID=1547922 RepID=UPI0009E915C9|nr:toll/interleukin-1 receptor domain-containing protein [Piscinibacter sakaiensis]
MQPRRNVLFISHASEDKDAFVRPLAHELKKNGLQVWYDEFSLKLGDSLRRSIDRGLAECTAGIVVLSRAFFSKEWPQRELDALYSSEIAGRSRIIPVWHQVDSNYIASISPLLADRYSISSARGVDSVARIIAEQFPPEAKFSGRELADLLMHQQSSGIFGGEAIAAGCRYRFLQMNAFKEEYQSISQKAVSQLTDDQIENFPSELDQWLDEQHKILRVKHRIPEDAYLVSDEPIREDHLASYLTDLEGWASGTLSRADSVRLVIDLDNDELDEYYVLLGLPNFSFSGEQRSLLEQALIELGCGFESGYVVVDKICQALMARDSDA